VCVVRVSGVCGVSGCVCALCVWCECMCGVSVFVVCVCVCGVRTRDRGHSILELWLARQATCGQEPLLYCISNICASQLHNWLHTISISYEVLLPSAVNSV